MVWTAYNGCYVGLSAELIFFEAMALICSVYVNLLFGKAGIKTSRKNWIVCFISILTKK